MKKARSSITGRFVSKQYAKEHPDTTQIEEHPDYMDIKATRERDGPCRYCKDGCIRCDARKQGAQG